MNELGPIIKAYESFIGEGRRSVLITLVSVKGSAYRRPGARMLVDDEGRIAGSVSGGCLEGDLAEHARFVLEKGEPKTVFYDLSGTDELAWGLGMGCPGTIRVLLEPVDEELAARLSRWALPEEPVVLGTVFLAGEETGLQPGDRFMVRTDGSIEGSPQGERVMETVREEGLAVIASRRPVTKTVGEGTAGLEMLLEYLEPARNLVIFGLGQDTEALAQQAAGLNWEVILVDPGGLSRDETHYPDSMTVLASDPVDVFDDLEIGNQTAVVLMSHNYPRDLALLDLLHSSSAPYIGLLGAASRRDSLLSELGSEKSHALEGRLYAPVGLDIGADRPEEIALAVMSEIQAVFTGRGGGFLRDREQPIHDRTNGNAGD